MGTQTQSAQNATYSKCKSYFVQQIKIVNEDIEDLRVEMKALDDENKAAYSKIGKEENRLYGSNLLNFIVFEGCFLFPFVVITILLCFFDISAIVRLIPVMVGLILSLVIAIVKMVKRVKYAKERATLYSDCQSAETQFLSYGKSFKQKKIQKKKMVRIFKTLKSHPNMSEEEVLKLKAQFDKI